MLSYQNLDGHVVDHACHTSIQLDGCRILWTFSQHLLKSSEYSWEFSTSTCYIKYKKTIWNSIVNLKKAEKWKISSKGFSIIPPFLCSKRLEAFSCTEDMKKSAGGLKSAVNPPVGPGQSGRPRRSMGSSVYLGFQNTGFELAICNLQFAKRFGSLQICFCIFSTNCELLKSNTSWIFRVIHWTSYIVSYFKPIKYPLLNNNVISQRFIVHNSPN